MSMNTYALNDNGLLITQEVAAWIILAFNKKENGLSPDVLELVNSGRFAELAKSESVSDELFKALGLDPQDFMCGIAGECLDDLEIEYVHDSMFDGSARTIVFPGEDESEGSKEWEFREDDLWYIPLQKAQSLFAEQVYACGVEIIEEMRERMKGVLPENFNYRSALVSIDGTIFC